MRLETFFEKFDLLAEVPGAVARLRDLVLSLATQGRLTDRLVIDEPAQTLFERIQLHLQQLRAEGQVRWSPIEQLDETDLRELPEGWSWVPLGSVVEYGSAEKAESEQIANDAWLLDLEDVEKDTSRLLRRKLFRESPSKSTKSSFAAGDVLYGKLRPYLNKVLVADQAGFCTTEIVPIRTFGLIEPEYLCLALKRPDFLVYANRKSYGMNLPRLGTEDARRAPFPLAPLGEQKRIVAKVDELMALCDRLEAQQLERQTRHAALARASLARFGTAPTVANLGLLFDDVYGVSPKELRNAILGMAVQGRLSAQVPSDGDARHLIDVALEKRRQTISSKGLRKKDLDATASESTEADLPSSWCVERLGNLVDPERTISYGVLVPGSDMAEGIPFVRAQDLYLSGHPAKPNKSIAPEIEAPYARTRLVGGEILLCVVGSIGKLGVVPESWAGANIARAVARIKPIPEVLREYLLIVLQEEAVQSYFASATRTLAQPTLNVAMIEQTPIPLPPYAEQERIVARVSELMRLVEQLEAQLDRAQCSAARVLDATVDELAAGA